MKFLYILTFILPCLLMPACSMDNTIPEVPPDQRLPLQPGFHVTVNGSPAGDGSVDAPWDLSIALASSTIMPGDTIYLHGGTYRGVFVSGLNGRPDAPIRVRPWANETVIIDGAGFTSGAPAVLAFEGSYTWLSGVTITNSAADHYNDYVNDNAIDGVYFVGRVINCKIA